MALNYQIGQQLCPSCGKVPEEWMSADGEGGEFMCVPCAYVYNADANRVLCTGCGKWTSVHEAHEYGQWWYCLSCAPDQRQEDPEDL